MQHDGAGCNMMRKDCDMLAVQYLESCPVRTIGKRSIQPRDLCLCVFPERCQSVHARLIGRDYETTEQLLRRRNKTSVLDLCTRQCL